MNDKWSERLRVLPSSSAGIHPRRKLPAPARDRRICAALTSVALPAEGRKGIARTEFPQHLSHQSQARQEFKFSAWLHAEFATI